MLLTNAEAKGEGEGEKQSRCLNERFIHHVPGCSPTRAPRTIASFHFSSDLLTRAACFRPLYHIMLFGLNRDLRTVFRAAMRAGATALHALGRAIALASRLAPLGQAAASPPPAPRASQFSSRPCVPQVFGIDRVCVRIFLSEGSRGQAVLGSSLSADQRHADLGKHHGISITALLKVHCRVVGMRFGPCRNSQMAPALQS
jgi:hypothetical protein